MGEGGKGGAPLRFQGANTFDVFSRRQTEPSPSKKPNLLDTECVRRRH